jgi:hypothetical protein
LARHLKRSLDQSPIHLRLNETFSEGHQRPFAERCLIRIQAVENQLPPPIHERRFNDFII